MENKIFCMISDNSYDKEIAIFGEEKIAENQRFPVTFIQKLLTGIGPVTSALPMRRSTD